MSDSTIQQSADPTHYEFTLKMSPGKKMFKQDQEEVETRESYQKFLRDGFWFLVEGETAIPGLTIPMLSGLQEMREAYHQTKSIEGLEVPVACRDNMKIADYNPTSVNYGDPAVLIWVVQREQLRKGAAGALIPQPATDPEIPECSIGARIPLSGNPVPTSMLLSHPEFASHFPRIDPNWPNELIESPGVRRAREEELARKEKQQEKKQAEEDKKKAEAAKERREEKAALQPVRSSARIPNSIMAPLQQETRKPKADDTSETIEVQPALQKAQMSTSEEDELNDAAAPTRKIAKPKTSAHQSSSSEAPVPKRTRNKTSTSSNSFSDEQAPAPKRTKAKSSNSTDYEEAPSTKRTRTKSSVVTINSEDDDPPKRTRMRGATIFASANGQNSTGTSGVSDAQDPPMIRGQKPKSRIAKKCVNCGFESSMGWRNQETPLRNDCQGCGKRRDRKM